MAVLHRLARRYQQIVSNAHSVARDDLTEGELLAILPNAAILDRANIHDLSLRTGDVGQDPLGASDLTNQLNEPNQRVLLHPVLSLWDDLSHYLADHNAPTGLCNKVEDVFVEMKKAYAEQLKVDGLDPKWPEFRLRFEKALGERKLINFDTYSNPARRPRPGCSTEYVLDDMAKHEGLVPDFAMLDRLLLRGELFHKYPSGPALDQAIEVEYVKNRMFVQTQLAEWEKFTNGAAGIFRDEVEIDQVKYSKAWYYACKAIPAARHKDLLDIQKDIGAFTEKMDPVEKLVINQAADTATATVVAPAMDERIVNGGLNLAEKATATILTKIGKFATKETVENVADKAATLAETAVASALPGGILWWLVARGAHHLVKKQVEDRLDKGLEQGTEKVAHWAKKKAEELVYEESRSAQTERAAMTLVEKREHDKTTAVIMLPHLTASGRRAALNVIAAYEAAINPENLEKVVDFTSKDRNEWQIRLARMCHPNISARLWENEAELRLPKNPENTINEEVQIGRMATSSVVESVTNISRGAGHIEWAHGHNRLTHRLQMSKKTFEMSDDLEVPHDGEGRAIDSPDEANEVSDDVQIQFFEESLQQECCVLLSAACQQNLYPFGDSYQFSGQAIASLLYAADREIKRQTGRSSLAYSEGYDWSILMSLNTALWNKDITPNNLRAAIIGQPKYSAMPASFEEPMSGDDLRIAQEQADGIHVVSCPKIANDLERAETEANHLRSAATRALTPARP